MSILETPWHLTIILVNPLVNFRLNFLFIGLYKSSTFLFLNDLLMYNIAQPPSNQYIRSVSKYVLPMYVPVLPTPALKNQYDIDMILFFFINLRVKFEPAVNDDRTTIHWIGCCWLFNEAQNGKRMGWSAMIGPICVMVNLTGSEFTEFVLVSAELHKTSPWLFWIRKEILLWNGLYGKYNHPSEYGLILSNFKSETATNL